MFHVISEAFAPQESRVKATPRGAQRGLCKGSEVTKCAHGDRCAHPSNRHRIPRALRDTTHAEFASESTVSGETPKKFAGKLKANGKCIHVQQRGLGAYLKLKYESYVAPNVGYAGIQLFSFFLPRTCKQDTVLLEYMHNKMMNGAVAYSIRNSNI